MEVVSLASVIGEDELSKIDKKYLNFGRLLESKFINQGFNENRSIEQSLDLAWLLLSTLPRSELDRLDDKLLDVHYRNDDKMEQGKAVLNAAFDKLTDKDK